MRSAIEEFLDFVRRAEPLVQAKAIGPPVAEFTQLIEKAKPIMVPPLRDVLRTLVPRMTLIRQWWTPHDLLRVAGFTYAEDPYTELIAWALDPATHPASATQRQSAWLRRAPFAGKVDFDHPAIPRTQLVTPAGIPDLVLEYERCAVVLETKTHSREHRTPRGNYQTIDYPPAVKRQLGLRDSMPVWVVFLTPDRQEAVNPDAFNTTFVEFSLALAEVLGSFDLPNDLHNAYAMLFTHFLSCATVAAADLGPALDRFSAWEEQCTDDSFLIAHLDEITGAVDRLPEEVTR